MWAFETTLYQIYPLGLLGCEEAAPAIGDEAAAAQLSDRHRLLGLEGWVDHLERLGVGAVLLNPVFASDTHGYDTRDLRVVDPRLGTNEDLARVVAAFHDAGIRVILDAVFNHVGRGFWAFRDVQERRWDSAYKDWFCLNFDGDSGYGDGFWYEGWEGHYELVKLNLANPAVCDHLLGCVRGWREELGIDGLRLDVAYSLDRGFMGRLRGLADELSAEGGEGREFVLIGEMLHGDYSRVVRPELLDSCTNYECYKGLYSSLNSMNLFEIAHSLHRQFGPDPWCIYQGLHLMSFVDNHDVTRLASILTNPAHVRVAYGLLFGMPGIPCLYYGSEWGIEGQKVPGTDAPLRPAVEAPEWIELTDWIAELAAVRAEMPALCDGAYRNVVITNRQLVFERVLEEQRVLVAVNADETAFEAHDGSLAGTFAVLAADGEGAPAVGESLELAGSLTIPPYGTLILANSETIRASL